MAMTTPMTLTYFDFPGGRGEASRLAIHVVGADWTDDRFTGSWPTTKPTTPFGALPILEVPGQGTLFESNAILGYIGRTHGLLPAEPFEAARHLGVMSTVEALRAVASSTSRDDDDALREARTAYVAGPFGRWATQVSAQIRGPFVGGSELSVADLKLFVAMRSYTAGVYDHIPADVLDPFPKITGLIEAVAAHPRVVDWYSAR